MNEENITYLLMTESLYPKDAAIGCLDSIKKEFKLMYQNRNFDLDSNFALDDEFKVKLRMKFDYFNANTDISNETIGKLKDEVNRMKDEVLNASGLLDNRGEKLKVLDEKSDALSTSSHNYYKSSKKVKRAEWMKRIKLYIAIGVAFLVIIIIIIFIVT